MKKIKMFLAIAILFIATINFSCGNKDKITTTTTTYQIVNDMPLLPLQNGDVYFDGSVYEVWVDCYVGSAIVKTDKFDKIAPAGGKTPKTEVNADKIKVSCKVLPSNDPILAQYNIADPRIYLTGFTTLKENTNNVVTITYDTPIDGKGNGLTVGTSITTIVKK